MKIDKTFINDIARSRAARGLIQAILRVARTFRLVTIVDGVEDVAQLERLRRLGRQQVQGHCISPRMSAEDVCAFLTAQGHDALQIPAIVEARAT